MNYALINANLWPLKKLNEKVCKQAVEWLDAGYAGWDAELWDSEEYWGVNEKVIETYFVPAVANVAPDFVRKEKTGNAAGLEKARQSIKQKAPQAEAVSKVPGSWTAAIVFLLIGIGLVWLVMALK